MQQSNYSIWQKGRICDIFKLCHSWLFLQSRINAERRNVIWLIKEMKRLADLKKLAVQDKTPEAGSKNTVAYEF